MEREDFIKEIKEIYGEIEKASTECIPLCAAENAVSDFVKLPLSTNVQEKYIMGGILEYNKNNNFVNSEKLFPIYQIISKMCKELYNCSYADARTLSGVNAVLTLLMSLFHAGDTILISGEDCGGHGSMPLICKRLGIKTINMPYDFNEMDFDYLEINEIIKSENISGILVCLSDILKQPHLERIEIGQDICLIYDATQVLGLIATDTLINPFNWFDNTQKFVLMGATHKTIPGPTCGLILCNNLEFAKSFDSKINPDYLRNNQLHHIMSLAFSLEELAVFGKDYMSHTVFLANLLGELLSKNGFDVVKIGNSYTVTHQIFILMDASLAGTFRNKAEIYNITLNARYKKLYKGSGIRLGLQEIARYGWGNKEIEMLVNVFCLIRDEIVNYHDNHKLIIEKIATLSKNKHIKYSFEESFQDRMKEILHNC